MRTSVLANAAILAGVAAAQLRLPVFHQPQHASSLRRRAPNAGFTGADLKYAVNVTVGTPPQELSLFVSLDSSETWLPAADACEEWDYLAGCTGGSCKPFFFPTQN